MDHSPEDSEIAVVLRRSGRNALIEIENDGPPLPSDSEPLFAPFYSGQLPSTKREHLGIGLYVARAVAEHMQGSLDGRSRSDGTGAVFVLALPAL